MKQSHNPQDYIFCLGKSFDFGWNAYITPRAVFESEDCMYDQHLPDIVKGWGQEMEGVFSCDQEMPPQAMHDDLIAQGFAYSPEFALFMSTHGCEEVFTPPSESAQNIGVAAEDKIHFLMISTGYVESQSVGVLLVRHVHGFDTGEEAHKHFSKVVKIIVERAHAEHRGYHLKDCCKAFEKSNPDADFCKKCGNRLKMEEACHDDLMNYVEGLLPGSLDSLSDGWETFREHGWEVPADMVPGRMAIIYHFRPVIEGVEDDEAPSHYCNEFSYSDIGMGSKPKPVNRKTKEVAPGVHQVSASGSVFAAPVATIVPANTNFHIGTNPCVNIPTQPAKIGTDECKKFIADLVLANPGLVAKEFSPADPQAEQMASVPKNWSRTSKSKDGKLSVREFDCKPLDDQLRAYVYDDGTKIVKVEIDGE